MYIFAFVTGRRQVVEEETSCLFWPRAAASGYSFTPPSVPTLQDSCTVQDCQMKSSTQTTPDWLLDTGNDTPNHPPLHCRPSTEPLPEALRRASEQVPCFVNCTCLHVPGCPHSTMASKCPHQSPQTQELLHVLLITLCDSQRRLWNIMHGHLDIIQ